MHNIQIIEDERFIKYADFDNNEVWLLSRSNTDPLDERIINIPEVTEYYGTKAEKFPKLLTEIIEKYPSQLKTFETEVQVLDDKGGPVFVKDDNGNRVIKTEIKKEEYYELQYQYEILTNDPHQFELRISVAPQEKMKVYNLENDSFTYAVNKDLIDVINK